MITLTDHRTERHTAPVTRPPIWSAVGKRIPQLGAAACGAALGAIWVAGGASMEIRLTLTIFLVAVVAWTATSLDDTLIALVAALAVVGVGGATPERFYSALGQSTVWLLVSSFIIAAAVAATGLANRLTAVLVRRANTVAGLFRWLTLALGLTALVMPATSGRAALALPLFVSVSKAFGNPRITRALALLFPTVILLSAAGSLLGAGAHLVTAEIVAKMVGTEIDYLRWMVLGAPFAIASCVISTEVILRMFLDQDERSAPVDHERLSETTSAKPWCRSEVAVAVIVATTVALWATSAHHGIDAAVLAIAAAVAVTLPAVGSVSLATAIEGVPWNLVVFLAATLALGESLVSSGAAAWLAEGVFGGLDASVAPILVIAVVAVVSLGAHLFVGSRSARASVLTPLVVLVGGATRLDPAGLAFMSAIAAGYCLTLTVSAKPVALFSKATPDSYTPGDLARLSAVLIPIHFALLMVFAMVVWPLLGLDVS